MATGHDAPTIMDEWSALETRLVISEVDDLLDAAATRLAQLCSGPALPRTVIAAILETLRDVDAARACLCDSECRIGET